MNNNLTEIVLVVDRSGSMYSTREDAEGGINTFIKEQKKLEGEANLTLVEFDHAYDFVCKGVPIKKAKKYNLVPRGSTALLDAVGRAISETGERLAEMDEQDRPGLVAFVIVTDGYENASSEYTLDQIKEMISHQEQKYSWQFTFLGAGADAFQGGLNMGINMSANYDADKTFVAYAATSSNLSRMRSAVADGEAVVNAFTDAELKSFQ